MRDYSNIYSLDQANKWMKTLNSMYGVNLDIEDIHRLFQKFGVWFKTKNIDGKDIKFYKKSDIVDLFGKIIYLPPRLTTFSGPSSGGLL